jgi:hypothetical protein
VLDSSDSKYDKSHRFSLVRLHKMSLLRKTAKAKVVHPHLDVAQKHFTGRRAKAAVKTAPKKPFVVLGIQTNCFRMLDQVDYLTNSILERSSVIATANIITVPLITICK